MRPLVITMGEPSGIGGELTLKAWAKRQECDLLPFFTIDDPERLKEIDSNMPIQVIENAEQALNVFDKALPVLPLSLKARSQAGVLSPVNGECVLESIRRGVELSLKGEASGVVTNPIHKAALYEIGFKHPGHTEFVAELCNQYGGGRNETPVMMLAAKDLRVVPLTVHIPLNEVSAQISENLICEKVRIINDSLRNDFQIETPRIHVAGLNPHAGEGGKIGVEDQDVIAPALAILRGEGIDVSGPYPADTMFHEQARRQYDVALGMYHDQALIPLKTLDFYGGVNVTLGLSVVRTSPDHGTALDIAGKNVARPDSLINAIKMAAEIAQNRAL